MREAVRFERLLFLLDAVGFSVPDNHYCTADTFGDAS